MFSLEPIVSNVKPRDFSNEQWLTNFKISNTARLIPKNSFPSVVITDSEWPEILILIEKLGPPPHIQVSNSIFSSLLHCVLLYPCSFTSSFSLCVIWSWWKTIESISSDNILKFWRKSKYSLNEASQCIFPQAPAVPFKRWIKSSTLCF